MLRILFRSSANALTASATIFEAVAEVENKFSKLVDKECDGISAEVKKWFKRLAVRRVAVRFLPFLMGVIVERRAGS